MDLTDENKKVIDAKSHRELLRGWRYSKAGDTWLQGETGEYWGKRMAELKNKDPGQAIADSKSIGWD